MSQIMHCKFPTIATTITKIIFIMMTCIFLSACNSGPDTYLKRSANNKIFDTKGFKGGKRTPLYNKKYVVQAKRNVSDGSYDDDELLFDPQSEEENIALANREMYREMIREENGLRDNDKKGGFWSLFKSRKSGTHYPLTTQASHIVNEDAETREHLKQELAEIKAMLDDARQDFASYKCPTATDLENDFQQKRVNYKRSTQNDGESINKQRKNDSDENVVGKEIIDPVHSI